MYSVRSGYPAMTLYDYLFQTGSGSDALLMSVMNAAADFCDDDFHGGFL